MKKSQTQFYELIGEKIRHLRKNSNLKLEDLTKKSGLKLSKASLSAIENGKQQISAYQLYCLGKGFNVPVDSFFEKIKLKEEEKDFEKIKNI
ncbi:MAG: Anaerobic benzoate catabolism transcriptional regulator [Patescibacteria group bacterium]|nr:Anaerobic benzoate catabolism transcriptional regulator [Patescibacteria group bacterium]